MEKFATCIFSVQELLQRSHFIIQTLLLVRILAGFCVQKLWACEGAMNLISILKCFACSFLLYFSNQRRTGAVLKPAPEQLTMASLFWILLIDSIVSCVSWLTPRTLHLQVRSWMKTRKIAAFSLHYKFSTDVSLVISWSVDKSWESYFRFYFLSAPISHPCVQCSQQQKELYVNRYLLVRFMRQNSWACQG